MTVKVELPFGLQTLAGCGPRIEVAIEGTVTLLTVIRALEARYPQLCGAILDHNTGRRRSLLRFFAQKQDISFDPLERELPAAIATGQEPLLIVGAIAGG